ncbi:MAG TPA: EF-hand domain-containing protein [Gammaproteobacteria bacterium]
MHKKLSIFIGSLALLSGAALAQTTTGQSPSTAPEAEMDASGSVDSSQSASGNFSNLDKDSNGEISRKEASSQADLARIFDRADSNRDGSLTQNEYQKALVPSSPSTGG